MIRCRNCGKEHDVKESKGTMKYPYCKKCWKKVWHNNWTKFVKWLEHKGEL